MLHSDPRLGIRYAAAARAAVAARTGEAVGDQLLDHYDQVLGERKAAVA
jgi:phosphatidylinositol alpha 1,6-mannosyltransferase